jgi:hypothetical protein
MKFATMKSPRRSKFITSQSPTSSSAISNSNLCDDDKIKLQSKDKLCDLIDTTRDSTPQTPSNVVVKQTSNFCTLPRKPRANSNCTFHTITFEKGPGKKSLGFTIVGGADSPRGALGIFIKSILPTGQAIECGLLRAGDEILAVNGNVCHDLSHQDAVRLFKSVRTGEIVLNICRRRNLHA